MWRKNRGEGYLAGTVILGNGLGSLRHGMLGQFTGEDQSDSGLDLFARDGALLVVGSNLAGLGSSALKNVIDKGVHDAHGLLGDVDLGVALTEDLENV